MIFKYDDNTKTKVVVESTASEIYTEFTGSDSLINADIVKSKINVRSVQTSGKVYVDEVSLQHIATGSLIAVPKLSSSMTR